MAQLDPRPLRHSRHPSGISTPIEAADGLDQLKGRPKKRRSDDATITFIKRHLCVPNDLSEPLEKISTTGVDEKPLHELLPPLTSSNEVDIQLYAIIAVLLHQFVQTWYSRITPDANFVAEIVGIVAHCTRGIEERLRHVDLENLLLDEVAALLDDHLAAVRLSHATGRGRRHDVGRIYHTLRPHPALTPPPVDAITTSAQQENETAWCRAHINRILALVLPPEDAANPCLNILVEEVVSETIMRNAICGKACQPWLLWEGVTKIINTLRPKPPLGKSTPASSINRLQQFGLLAPDKGHQARNGKRTNVDAMRQLFWSTLQHIMTAYVLIYAAALALIHARTLPPRQARTANPLSRSGENFPRTDDIANHRPKAIVEMQAWGCLDRLTSLQERMPWMTGLLSLMQWISIYGPGQVCRTNTVLDRLLSAQIARRLLDPALLPPVLQATRSALFPDNALAPLRVPPASDQVLVIKRECAKAIVDVMPSFVRKVYFATEDVEMMWQDVEETLELFGDPYINEHLVVALVDLLVVRVFPELGEESFAG